MDRATRRRRQPIAKRSIENPALAIDFFLLAERAEVIMGKLYLMGGGWNQQIVQDLTQPLLLSFAAGVRLGAQAANQAHTLHITIHDPNGQFIFGADARFVSTLMSAQDRGLALFALPVVGIPVTSLGTYTVHASLNNDTDQRTVSFELTEAPPPAQPAWFRHAQ